MNISLPETEVNGTMNTCWLVKLRTPGVLSPFFGATQIHMNTFVKQQQHQCEYNYMHQKQQQQHMLIYVKL